MSDTPETAPTDAKARPLIAVRPSRLLHRVGDVVANALTGLAVAAIVGSWIAVGVATGFPQWWETSLYSATATVTLVMVFVIQHTQTRQISALQRKLDELIRSSTRADNTLISVERAPEAELQNLANQYADERQQVPPH